MFSMLGFSQQNQNRLNPDSLLKILANVKHDSIKINLLNKLTLKTTDFNFNQITRKKLIDKSLKNAIQIDYKIGQGNAYISLGNYYDYEFKKAKALENHNKALLIFSKLKNDSKVSKIYNSIGNIYADFSDYSKALFFYFKAAKINEEIKNFNKLAANYANIADIYNGINNISKSIFYANKSIKYAKLFNDESLLIFNYLLLAKIYNSENNLKESAKYVNESYRIALKINDLSNIPVSIMGMGFIKKKEKKYIEAIEKFTSALKKFTNLENDLGMASAYSEIGLSNYLMYDNELNIIFLDNAVKNLNLSNKLYNENNLIDGLSENYLCLSKIYELKKDYQESLNSFKLHTKYNDSIFNSDKKETIKNLEDKREIELRDKEIKINKLSLESKEKQKWFYILGISFLTILGGLLSYQNHKRKQINSKLETLNQNLDQANKTKTRFFSILNHDLRSPVANLIHFLHLQQDNPELLDEESKNRMQTKTITGAENLLSSMEDILLWSKSQMENFKPQPKNVLVNQLFEDTKKVFSGYLKIKFEYQNPENIEVFTDDNYLKTIIRNLTSNAINVLSEDFTSSVSSRAQSRDEKQIIWKAWQDNGKSYLSITDNGSGSSKENFKALYDDTEVVGIKTGLGLHLIRDLAKAIDCEISVDSKIGERTTFILEIKN